VIGGERDVIAGEGNVIGGERELDWLAAAPVLLRQLHPHLLLLLEARVEVRRGLERYRVLSVNVFWLEDSKRFPLGIVLEEPNFDVISGNAFTKDDDFLATYSWRRSV